MTFPRKTAVSVLLLGALGVAACADDPEEPVPERYTLVRTGIGPLPFPLGARRGCRFTLIGGEVALLEAQGRYTSHLAIRQRCRGGMPADTVIDRGTTGAYEALSGDTVRFMGTQDRLSGIGTLRGDTLSLVGPQHTLIFVRDPEP